MDRQTQVNEAQAQPYLKEYSADEANTLVQAILNQITGLWGVSMPALFFRALATMPDALPACWRVIAPYALGGQISHAAQQLRETTREQLAAIMAPIRVQDAGLSTEELQQISLTLAAFNRANPQNLVSAAILANRGNGPDTHVTPAPAATWQPPAKLTPPTPMLELAEMDDRAKSAIDALRTMAAPSGAGSNGQAVIIPSLYRHLAGFPSFLESATTQLSLYTMQPQLEQLGKDLQVEALNLDIAEAGNASPSERIPFDEKVEQLIGRFLVVIPEMVVTGLYLERLTDLFLKAQYSQ